MAIRKDLTGMRFGMLEVIEYSHSNDARRSFWECKCDCGNKKAINGSSLSRGASNSCGCMVAEAAKKRLTKHGLADTKLYYIWENMLQRCQNPNQQMYRHYGGRGIKVCDEWQTFEGFLKDMGDSWSEGLSIDRSDNNKGYCKENCKWIPRSEQAKNRRPSSEWVRNSG